MLDQRQVLEDPARVTAPPGRGKLAASVLVFGVALVVVAVAAPFYGWAGMQSVGPAIAIGAGLLLTVSARRRVVAAAALAAGLLATALVIARLSSEPTSSIPALQAVSRDALSHGWLYVALAGSGLVSAGAAMQLIAPGALVGSSRPIGHIRRWSSREAHRVAMRDTVVAMLLSRGLIWLVAVVAVAVLGVHPNLGPGAPDRPFGSIGRAVVAPASAWDSGAYLTIARSGYAIGPSLDPFFPLYSLLIRLFAWSPQSAVISAIVLSLIASTLALYLLHRLVGLDYGERVARLTVLLIAFFPTSLFLSAIYSEPFFLAASVASIYAARKDMWVWAGLAGAIAAACRSDGAVVLVPLAVIYLYGPRPTVPARAVGWRPHYRLGRDAAWLLLVPLPIVMFLAYMGIHGNWQAPLQAEHAYWGRTLVPFAGLWRGFSAALHHTRNFNDAAFLLLALVSLAVAVRTLPLAYWAYALVSIVVLISTVEPVEPLQSLPRFVLVIFPLWLALARWAARKPWRAPALLIPSGVAMVVFASIFARGGWIA